MVCPPDCQHWPSRTCACVALNTEMAVLYLTRELMLKHYGREITRESGIPWPRCKVCGGSGVDRRP